MHPGPSRGPSLCLDAILTRTLNQIHGALSAVAERLVYSIVLVNMRESSRNIR